MSSIIIDPVRTHAAAMPQRIAVGCCETGRTWTWAAFDAAIDRAAAWLVGKLGSASGARVAALAKNHPNMLVLQYACERAGRFSCPTTGDLPRPRSPR